MCGVRTKQYVPYILRANVEYVLPADFRRVADLLRSLRLCVAVLLCTKALPVAAEPNCFRLLLSVAEMEMFRKVWFVRKNFVKP